MHRFLKHALRQTSSESYKFALPLYIHVFLKILIPKSILNECWTRIIVSNLFMFQADGEEGCKMTTASLSASNVFICDKVPPTVNKGSL